MSFNFNAPVPAQQQMAQSATGFSFGGAKTTATPGVTQSVPAFGAPSLGATALGATGLGTAAAPAFNAPTMATNTAAAAPSFGFGTPAPAFGKGGGLGIATAPTAQTGSTNIGSFGLGGGTSFSFAKAATTAPASGASLSFGTTTTSTPFNTGGGSLFGKMGTTTALSAAPIAVAAAPFVGLGGIDVSATQPKAGDSKQDVKVKETYVPDEIAKTVDDLKGYIKSQKTLASDIGRTSTSKLTNVSSEIGSVRWALQETANAVEANYMQIKLLRQETTKTIQSVEMAQRTQDTPAGLQFENSSPFQYFQMIVAKYEQDLIAFRQQITATENHMQSLTNPQAVTPEDLKRGFRQINESFISLAGRLHEIHQRIESQKEQFLNLRKYRLRDSTNVFAKIDNPPQVKLNSSHITAGPTPFSNISAMSNFSKHFANSSATAATTVASAAGGVPGSSGLTTSQLRK